MVCASEGDDPSDTNLTSLRTMPIQSGQSTTSSKGLQQFDWASAREALVQLSESDSFTSNWKDTKKDLTATDGFKLNKGIIKKIKRGAIHKISDSQIENLYESSSLVSELGLKAPDMIEVSIDLGADFAPSEESTTAAQVKEAIGGVNAADEDGLTMEEIDKLVDAGADHIEADGTAWKEVARRTDENGDHTEYYESLSDPNVKRRERHEETDNNIILSTEETGKTKSGQPYIEQTQTILDKEGNVISEKEYLWTGEPGQSVNAHSKENTGIRYDHTRKKFGEEKPLFPVGKINPNPIDDNVVVGGSPRVDHPDLELDFDEIMNLDPTQDPTNEHKNSGPYTGPSITEVIDSHGGTSTGSWGDSNVGGTIKDELASAIAVIIDSNVGTSTGGTPIFF